jgi:glycosyltransferase involved in cell wall biosynthesis
MKIYFLIPSLEKGGIERSLSRISKGLIDNGWEVIMLTSEVSEEGKSYFENSVKFITVKTLFKKQNSIIFQLLKNIILFFKFKEIINKNNVDLVLAAKNLPMAVLLKKYSKSEFKLFLREAVHPFTAAKNQRSYINRKFIIFLKKKLYPYADKIIAISEGVKKSLIDQLKMQPNKIDVIYNPAGDERIIELSKEKVEKNYFSNNFNIINIGRLTKQKDHITLLKAMKIVLKKVQCNLIIIGEGSERDNIYKFIQDNNLESNVDLIGYKSNPWKYLSRSDLFVLSSIWEGFGNVIVESMMLGVPVISSDCNSGPSEILGEGKYGDLFEIRDYKKLSELIINKFNSSESKKKLNLGLQRSNNFSINEISKKYSDSFKKLLA